MLTLVQEALNREFAANQTAFAANQDIGLQEAMARERGLERATQVGLQGVQSSQGIAQTLLASSQMLSQLGQQDSARQLEIAQAEERGTVRRTQAIETAIATLQGQGQQDLARQLELATATERALSRQTEATIAGYAPLLQAGEAQTGRLQEAYSAYQDLGALYRSVEQEQLANQYNDYLRQQALVESAVYTPFGQLVPSAIGSRVAQSGGGLFK